MVFLSFSLVEAHKIRDFSPFQYYCCSFSLLVVLRLNWVVCRLRWVILWLCVGYLWVASAYPYKWLWNITISV